MRTMRSPIRLAVILILLSIPLAALAQTDEVEVQVTEVQASASPNRVNSSWDRLFYSFIEDAAMVENQWWEGQIDYADGDDLDTLILRGTAAFQPWKRWEIGGRIGFGRSDSSSRLSDGTGATDLDAWAKYYAGQAGSNTEFTVGGIVTLPTGDDGASLGADAWALSAFGAMRQRFKIFILSISAGVVFNGDGQVFVGDSKVNLEGRTAPRVSAAAIFPFSDRVSFVAETLFEGERFEGGDSDIRLLGGVNYRVANRGQFRGAVGFGFTDASPTWQLLASYAYTF